MALVLAVLVVGSTLLFALPTAVAPFQRVDVTPGQYSVPGLVRHPWVYVPDEVLTFTIVSDTAGEIYDAVIVVRSTGQILQGYDDMVIPAGLSLTLTYQIVAAIPDGDDYQIEVGTDQYIESGRSIFLRYELRRFAVQAYTLSLEVDRPAYIGGDDVIVTWSANNLKGGSLAPAGFGQVWMFNTNGQSLITPQVFTFSDASGSQTFALPDLADPRFDGIVYMWFNDTPSNPDRFQDAFTNFQINNLGVLVDVRAAQYPPSGIVPVDVTTVVTNNQPNPSPFDPPEPDVDVRISVWELTPGGPVERAQYGATGLVTDAHGELTYVFQLDAGIADGTDFEVRANASHKNGIWRWEARDGFTVSIAAGITMILEFNQNEYQAGDTATATAIVSGVGGATLTYIYEVRDTTNTFCDAAVAAGTLLAASTRAENTFSYVIGANFDGRICFRVTADDGAGNRVRSAREFQVFFGWLLVNADRQEYNPGDRVTITWELKSNRIDPTQATYFYEVRDVNNNLVTSGSADRSFVFTVPDPASDWYSFQVTASQGGRAVTGGISLRQVAGFFLSLSFDRKSYAPGDTMVIQYRISPRSADSILPNTFTIVYGLGSFFGPVAKAHSTPNPSGEMTYVVPVGIDEGTQIFFATEFSTGAGASQVIEIRGTNPLWFVDIGDVPLLVVLMLLWLVLLTLLLWRRGALGAMAPKAAPAEPAPPGPQEPVHAPPTSPMTVACRSCGSPIDITTSKRPIEVMCPKCGNTEMVA